MNIQTNTKEHTLAAAILMLGANGKTTTLEVKTLLRAAGFMANQADVSRHMDELFNEEKFDRALNPNGIHWDYIPLAPEPADEADIDDGSNVSTLTNVTTVSTPVRVKAVPHTQSLVGMPLGAIASNFDQDDWIAFDSTTGTAQAYPKTFTRDKCRASLSRILGIPYGSVRCQTVSYYTRARA